MTRLLISTAIAGLLALSGPALAQGHDDHHDDHNRPAPAAAPARGAPPAPAARGPAGGRNSHDSHPGPAAHNPPAAPDHRAQEDHRPSAGHQNAPAAKPAPRNAMRGPSNNNFASFHRNFNAPRHFRAPAYHRPSGWYSRRWTFGEILPALFWAPNYWLNDYVDYGLEPPPPGTVWVRDGDDALLIVRGTGEIIQVEYSVFY